MKEKIKVYWQKFKTALDRYLIQITCAAVVLIVIAFVCVACNIINNATESQNASSESSEAVLEWGSGMTENIPVFSGEIISQEIKENGYCAVYYSNATLEQVENYINQLEAQLSVDFGENERFPKTALWNHKLITLHYDSAEMKLSVTITEKSN